MRAAPAAKAAGGLGSCLGAAIIRTLLAMALISCAGTRPTDLGARDGHLSPCPSSPNCVSSDAADDSHHVEPFVLAKPVEAVWPGVREALEALPRTTIVDDTGDYLHAECRSALLRFVDDLELQLRPDQGIVAVRSASRLGHSDMGVNRRRVESLRAALRDRGVVR